MMFHIDSGNQPIGSNTDMAKAAINSLNYDQYAKPVNQCGNILSFKPVVPI